MGIRRPVLAVAFVACGIIVTTLHAGAASEPSPAAWRALTFDERVEAQRAIEQVYWSHRIWPEVNPTPKPPLEAVLSDEDLRAKVEDYLAKSTALARIWEEPITAEQLQAELQRMAVETRAPNTLRELFTALGDDALVIAETLARQTLADRRIRSAYAEDARLHEEARQRAESGLRGVTRATALRSSGARYVEMTWRKGTVEPDAPPPAAREVVLDDAEWESLLAELPATSVGDLRETDTAFEVEALLERRPDLVRTAKVSWSKVPFDVWWEQQANANLEGDDLAPAEGMPFLPAEVMGGDCAWDSWLPTQPNGAPFRRSSHTAVWTGAEMIVWGGWENDGGRYNPATNSWQLTSEINIPPGTLYNTAVWTGTRMIVWGGAGDGLGEYNNGGRYDPMTNTWAATSLALAPMARAHHTAVWTGSRMVVWGGINTCNASCNNYLNNGAQYNPADNTWTTISTLGAPSDRAWHTAVWTGAGGKMIVWGGRIAGPTYYNDGGRYDPVADTWVATSTGINVPAGRFDHTAVWAGTVMIVWGGVTSGGIPASTGGRYDPVGNSWTPTSTTGAPSGRTNHTAVWTDAEMIVWGGSGSGSKLNTGGRYTPSTDAWMATSMNGVPGAREKHSVVWTGSQMIVWGGLGTNSSSTSTGGRYCGLPCTAPTPWYRDVDLDNYGDPSDQQIDCAWPPGYVPNGGDCNDASSAVHPGAPEICNGIDDNCNAQTDETPQGVDSDADGVHNACDNCPFVSNPVQQDPDGDSFGNECDNCPALPNYFQTNADGDAAGDACDVCPLDAADDADADGRCANVDNCPGVANAGQEDGDVDLLEVAQWGVSAVASSEFSPGDYSAMQATGPPDSLQCWDLETNWSPEPGGPEPEWLEVTYGTVVPALGATVYEAFEGGFVQRVELRDAGGALHTVWQGGDTTACGQVFATSWPTTPYNVAGVRVHTAIEGWEEIDALALVGLQSQPAADGVGDVCDNCPALHNPGQDPTALWYRVLATDADHLGWPQPLTVEFVRGDLAAVSSYATEDGGSLTDALALDISSDAVAPGEGLYYLVKFPGACGSWQSAVGAEPGRDAALP